MLLYSKFFCKPSEKITTILLAILNHTNNIIFHNQKCTQVEVIEQVHIIMRY